MEIFVIVFTMVTVLYYSLSFITLVLVVLTITVERSLSGHSAKENTESAL